MKVKDLSDHNLISNTKLLVKNEQELVVHIIEHLEEIERRKLYADLKYSSLWDFCVQELGYTNSQAYRRINAMRAARGIPEVKTALTTGELNVTTVSIASEFFRAAEVVSDQEKYDLFEQIKGKSKRQVESFFAHQKEERGLSRLIPHKEVVQDLGEDEVRLHLTLDREILEKIKKLKGLLAHKKRKLSTEKLLEELLDAAIAKEETAKFGLKKFSAAAEKERTMLTLNSTCAGEVSTISQIEQTRQAIPDRSTPQLSNSRYISSAIKRQLYQTAGARCQNCGGTFALEFDHIHAYGKGGEGDGMNIRILCKSCNLRHAIKDYGADFMQEARAGHFHRAK